MNRDELRQFFDYEHLPEPLRDVSKQFCAMAWWIFEELPKGREQAVALRKLLEAKDAAVRAKVYKDPFNEQNHGNS